MRVAIVTHNINKNEGQGRVNYEIAQRALECGHQVILVSAAAAAELRAHPGARWIPMPVSGWPTQLVRNQVFAARSAHWLKRNRDAYDIVHTNGAASNCAGDVNAVHFVHSAWLRSRVHTARLQRNAYGLYQWLFTAYNSAWERRLLPQARRVAAVSDLVRTELIQIGVSPERIRVILNGVDLDEFHPGDADRAALGLPAGVPLALFVGDIRTLRKNLETVLKAMSAVPNLHLAVVGTVKGSPYPEMAVQLGVDSRTHFLGFRKDVADLMRSADVFVSPARYEPFSLVLLEAMACGLPVVTAKCVGAAQIITPDCGIVLADPDDDKALATALCDLTTDAPLRADMGIAARTIAEKYSWTVMADAYLSLYRELIS